MSTLITMQVAHWVCAGFTLISAAVSFGYSIAGLRTATGDARTPSLYALSRSVALLVVAVVAVFSGSIGFVAAVAVAMIIVQAVDAVIGGIIRDRFKTYGPAFTALFNLAALIWMLLVA